MKLTRSSLSFVWAICLLLTLSACNIDWLDEFGNSDNDSDSSQDNTSVVDDTDIAGLNVAVSGDDFTTTFQRLRNAVVSQQSSLGINQGALTGIDLQDLANRPPSDDEDPVSIRPTRVVFYNDAVRTTPIINADPRAGLDLPAALLIYQDSNGDVGVAYDNAAYFKRRYDVSDADDAIDALTDDAQSLAQTAAGNDVSVQGSTDQISRADGVIERVSNDDFPTTLNRLIGAINDDDSLDLLGQIDQRAAAINVGLTLGNNDNQSTLVLFHAGQNMARLLSGGQTVGIDLPERMLVSEADDGSVTLYYNAPDYLIDRHQIEGRANAADDLADTLSNLADTATDSNR